MLGGRQRAHLVENDGVLLVVITEWLIAVTMLAAVGVAEVSLATELMARTPEVPRDVITEAPGAEG